MGPRWPVRTRTRSDHARSPGHTPPSPTTTPPRTRARHRHRHRPQPFAQPADVPGSLPLLGRWFPRMALRLTGISTPADSTGAAGGVPLPAPSQPQSGGAFGNQLATQARTYLATNNLKSYQSLFQTATEHDDPHARYLAQVRLVEEGLAAAGQAGSSTEATQLFVAAADRGHRRARNRAPRADPPQLRRRRPVRAVEPRRRPRDLQGSARPRSGAAAPQAQPRRAGPSPARGQPERPLAQAPPRRGARARKQGPQDRQAGPPGKQPEAQPVHDRQGRGRDAPPLPGRGGARRRRNRDRRHGLERPHDRDRPRTRGNGHREGMDRLVRRRPQRLVRSRHRRLDHLSRRR